MHSLSLRPDEFSIDDRPSVPEELLFDGRNPQLAGGEAIVFKHPITGVTTTERVLETTIIGTNGSYIFTPSACDHTRPEMNVDQIAPEQLEGPLLVVDLDEPIAYGVDEIRTLLTEQGVELSPRDVPEYIVLFRTGLMDQILEGEKPDERPGLRPEAAQFLAGLNLARAYGIDSQSYEFPGHDGFPATQHLMNPQDDGRFTPIVYQLVRTAQVNTGMHTRIEIGNPPSAQVSWPVAVKVQTHISSSKHPHS